MSSNFERFQEIQKRAESESYSSLSVIWNPEICQDSPTCGQDDLVLLLKIELKNQINKANLLLRFFDL
jgi:hypothetical protein